MTTSPLTELNAAYRALERAQKGLEKAELSKKAELEARVNYIRDFMLAEPRSRLLSSESPDRTRLSCPNCARSCGYAAKPES